MSCCEEGGQETSFNIMEYGQDMYRQAYKDDSVHIVHNSKKLHM